MGIGPNNNRIASVAECNAAGGNIPKAASLLPTYNEIMGNKQVGYHVVIAGSYAGNQLVQSKDITYSKTTSVEQLYIHHNECVGCRYCMDVCPIGAIVLENNKLWINVHTCIGSQCEMCRNACPIGFHDVISIDFPFEEGGGPFYIDSYHDCIGCSQCYDNCQIGAIEILNGWYHINSSKCSIHCNNCICSAGNIYKK